MKIKQKQIPSATTKSGMPVIRIITYYDDSKVCVDQNSPLYGMCIGQQITTNSSVLTLDESIHPLDKSKPEFLEWKALQLQRDAKRVVENKKMTLSGG